MFHVGKACAACVVSAFVWMLAIPAQGSILWSHSGAVFVCDNGMGEDILHGAIKPQGTNSNNTFYFKIRVETIGDSVTKSIADFEAGFMFVEKGVEHLGVGNSRGAWAYCAKNVPKSEKGYVDLNSANPEPGRTWEYMRAGRPRLIVFKVEYVPGRDARVTAWLNPNLSLGASEMNQPTNIVTQFEANATFDEIHIIHRGGNGGGWKFSQMAAATSFDDFITRPFWENWWFVGLSGVAMLIGVGVSVRGLERRRSRVEIERLERERSVAAERARIARDIHDELGAELAQIGLLADAGCGGGRESEQRFERIAQRARNLVLTLDEIVWAIDPRNDNLSRLGDYLCQLIDECFLGSDVRCRKEVPQELPAYPIFAEMRHDVTLAVKEAFTNILKHARASEVKLGVVWNEPELTITVEDNGCGFKVSSAGQGNGLENQRTRLSRNGGLVELQTTPGTGTRTVFRIKLKK